MTPVSKIQRHIQSFHPNIGVVVGYILGAHLTKPHLLSVSITSDGFVLGTPEVEGQVGQGVFLGTAERIGETIGLLLDVAKLDDAEREAFNTCATARIEDWRPRNKQNWRW